MHLQHGCVRETIELRASGVEQTFTFTSLPERGELVIGIAVTTDLTGELLADGLRFASAHTDVRYSSAIAIDATGARIAAETLLVDGRIEIRVPADFVARASLPLVIDPVVASNIGRASDELVESFDAVANSTGEQRVAALERLGRLQAAHTEATR